MTSSMWTLCRRGEGRRDDTREARTAYSDGESTADVDSIYMSGPSVHLRRICCGEAKPRLYALHIYRCKKYHMIWHWKFCPWAAATTVSSCLSCAALRSTAASVCNISLWVIDTSWPRLQYQPVSALPPFCAEDCQNLSRAILALQCGVTS